MNSSAGRVLIFLCFLIPFGSLAQIPKRSEIGVFAGISNYEGGIAPDPVFKESHPAFGIIYKRDANEYFSYTASANYGTISGSDGNSKYNAPRGLKFQSSIFEVSGQIEFNFFNFGTASDRDARRFSPYVFTGLSFFHFDPTASYQGVVYHLQAENTSGQGFAPGAPAKYHLWQFAIPIGGGMKFNLNEHFNLLILAGYRATFTSDLDDAGSGNYAANSIILENKGNVGSYFASPTGIGSTGVQRGNPDKKDWYMFYGVTLSYIIPGRICPFPY
jgi:hypothetical protein